MVQLTRKYYERLGRATAGWALLEFGLDFLVAITFQEMGGQSKQYPEIPRSLSKKIGYLRFSAKLPAAEPWKDRLLDVADSIAALRDRRHTITHSVALTSISADKAKVAQMRYSKLVHYAEEHEISADDLQDFGKQIAEAMRAEMNLVEDLIRDFASKNPDEPISERLRALLG